MVGIPRRERADDGQAVRHLRQLRKGAAEGNAGQPGRHAAGDAAKFRGSARLRIERLDLRRPTLQEQQHDGLVLENASAVVGSACLQELRQRQAAEGQAADAQEFTSMHSLTGAYHVIGRHVDHDRTPSWIVGNWPLLAKCPVGPVGEGT